MGGTRRCHTSGYFGSSLCAKKACPSNPEKARKKQLHQYITQTRAKFKAKTTCLRTYPRWSRSGCITKKKILDTTIEIEGDSNTISGLLSSGESLLKLLAHFDENLLYHTTPVVAPVSSADGSASLDAQAGENLVRQMFATAWKDGKITKDEQQLLSDVVSFLGMHPDRARRLSEEAMGVPTTPPPEEVYLDMLRQALMDGELAEDEMVLIKTFQTALKLMKKPIQNCLRWLNQNQHCLLIWKHTKPHLPQQWKMESSRKTKIPCSKH